MARAIGLYEEARRQGMLWTPRCLGADLAAAYSTYDLGVGTAPDGGGCVVSSSTVTQLTDRSGLGRHLVTNGVDAVPAYTMPAINGRPGAAFGGSNVLATSAFSIAQPLGFVTLFQSPASAFDLFSVMLNDPANSNQLGFYPRHNSFGDRPIIYAGGAGLAMTPSAALATSTNYLITGIFNGTSSLGCVNGAAFQVGDAGTASMSGGFSISLNSTNVHFVGIVLDIIWFANATVDKARRIEGWTAWRSGLQNSVLDASHPYRNRPPLLGG